MTESIRASEDQPIASDLVGDAYFQRVKLAIGTDGVGTDVNAGAPLPAALVALLESGLSAASKLATASNNATNVKASKGVVYGWEITNKASEIRSVKLYNKASAPAPASDNALIVVRLPLLKESVKQLFLPVPIPFSSGIGFAIVKGIADTNNENVTAEDVTLNLFYA